LFLIKIITVITSGADKIQRLTLKPANLIAPISHENPAQQSQQGVSGPGEKMSGCFSFFSPLSFFLPTSRRQRINQN
jgi:hypothetical protein